MIKRQPCRHQGQCWKKAGVTPDREQKLSAAQERPMEEKAVPLQPGGNKWSRSPCTALEETLGQQWMLSERGTAQKEPLQEHPGMDLQAHPGMDLQAMEKSLQWDRKAWGNYCLWELCGNYVGTSFSSA